VPEASFISLEKKKEKKVFLQRSILLSIGYGRPFAAKIRF
jgi:hypothetical protein